MSENSSVAEVVLHVETPLIYSAPLSKLSKRAIYLKLENTQPTGSFKMRGIGNSCRNAVKAGATHLVCSSGGNAGLAAAYSAHFLGVKATVFTMDGLPQPVLKKFSDLGCDIYIGGPIWDICDRTARQYISKCAAEGDSVAYIHPFDSPLVWEGHSTMMVEVKQQLKTKPGAVITCVGGGGLLAGISHGLSANNWDDVPIIAMETHGADSYNKALAAGKPVKLDAITSIAKTLGALQVCDKVVALAGTRRIISCVVDDRSAVESCAWFMRDHQMLVEPSCGATLSAVYKGKLQEYLPEGGSAPIVVVVCGGATVDKDALDGHMRDFGISTKLDKFYPIDVLSFNL